MAKPPRGRISGIDGMATHTAVELTAWEEELRAQAKDPQSADDSKWLRRWAERMGKLAQK